MNKELYPEGNLLDQIIYEGTQYSIIDYEANGISIGKDFDYGLVGEYSKHGSNRDYVLDLEVIDNKLYGTKRIYHEKTEKWEKSERIHVLYTGHFVMVLGGPLCEGVKVTDFLESDTACELRFVDGELSDVNELDTVIEEWRNAVDLGTAEKKENFTQKKLRGAYNLRYGYATIAWFFSQSDIFANFGEEDEETDVYVEKTAPEKKQNNEQLNKQDSGRHNIKSTQKTENPRGRGKKAHAFDKSKAKRMSALGDYLINHADSGINGKLGFSCSLNAAGRGSERGMFNVGFCLLHGIGASQNETKALKCFKKLADGGSVTGCRVVALLCDDESSELFNLRLSMRYLEKAAQLGNGEAMVLLGNNYKIGRGAEKNIERAKYWYQKAIVHGNVDALVELAELYEHDLEDEEGAFEWYLQAAEKENAYAAQKVAFSYESGIGTDQNKQKGYDWYVKAAGLGNKWAKKRLMHLNPDGTDNIYSY